MTFALFVLAAGAVVGAFALLIWTRPPQGASDLSASEQLAELRAATQDLTRAARRANQTADRIEQSHKEDR